MSLWLLSFYYWYAVIELTCANDDYEHVHIKLHIPRITQKHYHVRTVENHHFHPKHIIKHPKIVPQANSIEPVAVLHSHPLAAISASSDHDYSGWDLDNTASAYKSKYSAVPQTNQWDNYYENDELPDSLPDFQSTYSLMKSKPYPKFHSNYNDYQFKMKRPQIINYERDESKEHLLDQVSELSDDYLHDERFDEPLPMSTNSGNRWLIPYENVKFNGWQQNKNFPKMQNSINWNEPKYLTKYENEDINFNMDYGKSGKSGKFIDYDYKNDFYNRVKPKNKTKSRYKSKKFSTGNRLLF